MYFSPLSCYLVPLRPKYFTTRTILSVQYRLLSSSLRIFLHSPVTSSLLGPNILPPEQYWVRSTDGSTYSYSVTVRNFVYQTGSGRSPLLATVTCYCRCVLESLLHGQDNCDRPWDVLSPTDKLIELRAGNYFTSNSQLVSRKWAINLV